MNQQEKANNKYLVIGSNCFTGSHIVNQLLNASNNKVYGISRSSEPPAFMLPYKSIKNTKNFVFSQIDLVRDIEKAITYIDKIQPTHIINVAALSEVELSHEVPLGYFNINLTSVVQLCDILRTRSYLEHYIHISSAEIYGSTPEPVREDSIITPTTPYAVSKTAADMYLLTLMQKYSFPVSMIRSTNVYGPYQQLFKIIPRCFIYIKTGQTINLHGGGNAVRHFIHIRDVVDAILLVCSKRFFGPLNFSISAEDQINPKYEIKNVVNYICKLMECKMEDVTQYSEKREHQDHCYSLDSTKANQILGWNPNIEFEEGITETYEWIKENWEEIKSAEHSYKHKE